MEAWIVENELVLTFVLNSLIAIGTLAAVVWAVCSTQREVRRGETYRREHLDQEERHQAERVTAWVREAPEVLVLADDDELDGDQTDGLRVLRVINTSDAPVYDVTLRTLAGAGSPAYVGRYLEVLVPADKATEIEIPATGIATSEAEVVLMTFSDAAGRCWERDAHGVLVRRADLDAVHRRVTGP